MEDFYELLDSFCTFVVVCFLIAIVLDAILQAIFNEGRE